MCIVNNAAKVLNAKIAIVNYKPNKMLVGYRHNILQGSRGKRNILFLLVKTTSPLTANDILNMTTAPSVMEDMSNSAFRNSGARASFSLAKAASFEVVVGSYRVFGGQALIAVERALEAQSRLGYSIPINPEITKFLGRTDGDVQSIIAITESQDLNGQTEPFFFKYESDGMVIPTLDYHGEGEMNVGEDLNDLTSTQVIVGSYEFDPHNIGVPVYYNEEAELQRLGYREYFPNRVVGLELDSNRKNANYRISTEMIGNRGGGAGVLSPARGNI